MSRPAATEVIAQVHLHTMEAGITGCILQHGQLVFLKAQILLIDIVFIPCVIGKGFQRERACVEPHTQLCRPGGFFTQAGIAQLEGLGRQMGAVGIQLFRRWRAFGAGQVQQNVCRV